MLFDGISLAEGTAISNATVASGTAFPSSASTGELFFRTDLDLLHVYDGSTWAEVGSGAGSGPASTTDLPEGTNLYFTNTRARAAISLTAGSSGATYDNLTGVLNLSALYSSVQTNQSNTFTKAQIVAPVTLTSASTISVDASLSNNFKLTMTVAGQLANPTNLVDGQIFNVRVAQNGTGGFALTYGSMYKFAGGDVPSNSTAPNAVDYLTCVYDASLGILLCSMARAFA